MKKTNQQILSIELIIIIWYLKDIIINKNINIFNLVMTLLVYMCLKVLYYIFKDKAIGSYIISTIILSLVICSIVLMDSLSYFILLNLIQLIHRYSSKLLLISMSALFILFFVEIEIEMFLVINTFVYISVSHIFKFQDKFEKLMVLNNSKNLDNHKLTSHQLNSSIHEGNIEHTTRLEERNDIAQKLHDELGHVLSGNTLQLEASLLVLDHDEEKARNMLRKVIDNLREGTESIRQILKSIKPETASMNIQTIKTILSKVKDKSDVKIDLIYNNEVSELSYKQWHIITLNIKEAMTNMIKYSEANICKITFERLNKMIKVSIKDNGIGCHVIKKGMGFQGMSERLISIKAQLILDGSDGFSIVMLLPIERGNG